MAFGPQFQRLIAAGGLLKWSIGVRSGTPVHAGHFFFSRRFVGWRAATDVPDRGEARWAAQECKSLTLQWLRKAAERNRAT